MKPRPLLLAALLGSGWLALVPAARAVILFGTDDPLANTTAPTGALAGSGWQYEGQFGSFLGTAIAPNYFITAAHLGGGAGATFIYENHSYVTTAAFSQPGSDLRIFQVEGTFADYAPLYTKAGMEVGQEIVVFGRGTQRGAETQGGWLWCAEDHVERWGQNTVTQLVTANNLGTLINCDFDQDVSPNEAHLSSGDSGGGLFIHDTDGLWKLAGVNYGVDGPFYNANSSDSEHPNDPFYAALYDAAGRYEKNGNTFVPVSGPSGFYSTEIAGQTDFINSVVPVPEPSSFLLPVVGAGLLVGRSGIAGEPGRPEPAAAGWSLMRRRRPGLPRSAPATSRGIILRRRIRRSVPAAGAGSGGRWPPSSAAPGGTCLPPARERSTLPGPFCARGWAARAPAPRAEARAARRGTGGCAGRPAPARAPSAATPPRKAPAPPAPSRCGHARARAKAAGHSAPAHRSAAAALRSPHPAGREDRHPAENQTPRACESVIRARA